MALRAAVMCDENDTIGGLPAFAQGAQGEAPIAVFVRQIARPPCVEALGEPAKSPPIT